MLPHTLTSHVAQPWRAVAEALPGMAALNRLFVQSHEQPHERFADRALATLGVEVDAAGDLDAIPATGPVIVVANHPTGALDGLALLSLLARRRTDVTLLANRWLAHVDALRDDVLLVDAFGDGRVGNRRPMREAVRHLRGGGALAIFPAGVVSHFHPSLMTVADPEWRDGIARLVRLTKAAVVPCFIDARNSWLFQVSGLLHPWLRTVLLPRELLARRGSTLRVVVGTPLGGATLSGATDRETADRLRAMVYGLPEVTGPVKATTATEREIGAEASTLAASQTLVETADYRVFWMTAAQAPTLLAAIGQAREATFRAAGEGTGADVDLDRFDRDYVHLVLWDRAGDALAGAYRMRLVDETLKPSCLYTRTLFHYDEPLVRALSPGLELGRAFVTPAHQKRHAPLMLLWTGIARYVAARPGIRHLFGAVSIGANYSPIARAFMAAYLRRHAVDRLRAPMVAPRHPLDVAVTAAPDVGDEAMNPQALSHAVQALDAEGKGIPVLLRQYLKLNARVLDFSIDPAFSNVLDVLVSIDLPAAPRALLHRYMGDDADRYLAYHRQCEAVSA